MRAPRLIPLPMTTHAGHEGASASGSESSSAGALAVQPSPGRRSNFPVERTGPNPDNLVEEALLAEAGNDVRGQPSEGRGRDCDACYDDVSPLDEVSTAGQACHEPGSLQASVQLEGAAWLAPKAELAERASKVFDLTAVWPTEVRKPLLAQVVTNAVVKDAIEVVGNLCDRDGAALSKAFGNFDQRVALGWLLADAAGMPLLDRPQALALGIKAQRANATTKVAIRDARKRAIAPARDAGKDVPTAQDEAEAAVLCADANVLTSQLPPAKLAAAAPAAREPTGSRKRAREPELSREQEERIAEDSLLKAEKLVSRAKAELEKAEDAEDAATAKLMSVIKLKPPDRPWETWRRWHDLFDTRSDQHDEAELAAKDAEIKLLRAQLDERDALLELVMLQWAHSNAVVDSVTDLAARAIRHNESVKSQKKSAVARSELGSTDEPDSDP